MECTGTGPGDAAVDRTRAALAALGADPESAPDVPPEVTERITTALRNAHTVAAPTRPACTAPTTPARASASSTGTQSAVTTAKASPGVAVTRASVASNGSARGTSTISTWSP